MSTVTCKRRRLLSANSKDLKFYEQHWHHKETHRPPPPTLNNNLTLSHHVTCPECQGEVTYERDHDETVCTGCGLVVSTSHRYVRGQRIYIPFIDDTPPTPEYDRIQWWRQFYITYHDSNLIYPDDRRYYSETPKKIHTGQKKENRPPMPLP